MLSRHTAGLMVTERNWLDVYPYTSWGGNANLPVFTEGQKFMPTTLMLKEVSVIYLQSALGMLCGIRAFCL